MKRYCVNNEKDKIQTVFNKKIDIQFIFALVYHLKNAKLYLWNFLRKLKNEVLIRTNKSRARISLQSHKIVIGLGRSCIIIGIEDNIYMLELSNIFHDNHQMLPGIGVPMYKRSNNNNLILY